MICWDCGLDKEKGFSGGTAKRAFLCNECWLKPFRQNYLTPEEQARINEPSSGLKFYRPEWERQLDTVK